MVADKLVQSAQEAAEQQTKGEPDLSYFLEIKPATTIMHLMFSFINTALIPLSQTSLTTRREMSKLTNNTLAGLERKINCVIQRTIDSMYSQGHSSPLAVERLNVGHSCAPPYWDPIVKTEEARF